MDQLTLTKTDWGASAKIYAELAPQISFYRETAARLMRGAVLQSGMEIADVGAGSSGILENSILSNFPDINVIYCVDPFPEMLQELRKRIHDSRIKLIHSSAEMLTRVLPLVDRILCNAAAWNFDLLPAFREIHDALRPGGEFLFTISEWDIEFGRTLSHDKYELIDKELLRRGLPPKQSRGSANKLTVEELMTTLKSSGFDSVAADTFFVKADAHDYELLYRIPAIAARSLPHVSVETAMDILVSAVKHLGRNLPPVEWMLFCAKCPRG